MSNINVTYPASNISININKRIQLDVGGHIFSTTISTLMKDPESVLAKMFGGDFTINREDDGTIFIDRDGTHFRQILNFLRDGKLPLTGNEEVLKEMKAEAEYYNLGGLVTSIERQLTVTDKRSFQFLFCVDYFKQVAMGVHFYILYCHPNEADRLYVGAASGLWNIGKSRCRVRGILVYDRDNKKVKLQIVAAPSFGPKNERISENDAKLKVVVTAVSQEEDGREWKLGEADVETFGLIVHYPGDVWSEPQDIVSFSSDEVTKERPWLVHKERLFLRFEITVLCDVNRTSHH